MAVALCALAVVDAIGPGPRRLPVVARIILWVGAAGYVCSTVVLERAIRRRFPHP